MTEPAEGELERTPRQIAEEIARAGDYWKDYESIHCQNTLASGKKCGQRYRAGMIDVMKLTDRIEGAILAAVRARLKEDEWQPIETAPSVSDVPTKVWVWHPSWPKAELLSPDGEWWRYSLKQGYESSPTHWKPCTAPKPPVLHPKEAGKG